MAGCPVEWEADRSVRSGESQEIRAERPYSERSAWADTVVRTGLPMKRVVVEDFGGPEVSRVVDDDVPRPGPGEVRVRVLAAGVSFNGAYLAGCVGAMLGMVIGFGQLHGSNAPGRSSTK